MTKFTQDENTFIDRCFHSSRIIFIDNPKKRDNDKDILFNVNYMHDRIGNIGVDNHKHMHSIFNKLGYCKDGKTSLEQERLNKALEEQRKEKEFIENRNKAIDKIRAKKAKLQKLEDELLAQDEIFITRARENKKLVLENLAKKEKLYKEQSQSDIIQKANKQIDEMTVPELREVAKEKQIKNYSKMRKAELQIAIGEL